VPVLLVLAGAVILVGVVAVALGRGGEMAEFASDYLPPTMDGVVTAADVASVRPPSALWGYNVQVTDEAFSRIAQVVTERDVEIAVLRQQLAELRPAAGGQPSTAAEFGSATGGQPSATAELSAAWGTGARTRPGRPAGAGEPGAVSQELGDTGWGLAGTGRGPAAGTSEPDDGEETIYLGEQATAGEPGPLAGPGGAVGPAGAAANRDE